MVMRLCPRQPADISVTRRRSALSRLSTRRRGRPRHRPRATQHHHCDVRGL